MTLLQSFGNDVHNDLVLLAPADSIIPTSFTRRHVDKDQHTHWLNAVQRMRGRIYLADQAVEASQLTPDGRHVQDADDKSWHLLAVDPSGDVQGCARYRHLTGRIGFDDLGVRDSWLAKCAEWGTSLRAAVESEIDTAVQKGKAFSEVGGWAIVPEKRCTTEALRIAMATFSLAQVLGGCVGISTATERHRSSSILRRIGGRSLKFGGAELPSYYDPQYRCQMEVLRFDSNSPDASCKRWVDQLSKRLAGVAVIGTREVPEPRYAPVPQPSPWIRMPQLAGC